MITPTLVLVHGGLHGGWCFDLLVDELRALDIPAIAVDLPAEDPDLGVEDYAGVVLDAMAGVGPVVLLGHSIAGLIVPVVAARAAVERMIFLCALPPVPGISATAQFADEPAAVGEGWQRFGHDALGRLTMSADDAKHVFYHDCPDELADWAAARLRPQATKLITEPCPLEAWPDTPSSVIFTTDDRGLPAEWVRTAIPNRLGVRPIELPGGHSPFLSRPGVLAGTLRDQLTGAEPAESRTVDA